MGQHFAHLVEESRRAGLLDHYYTPAAKDGDPRARPVQSSWPRRLMQFTPLRFFPDWTTYVLAELYDHAVASRLEAPSDRFMAFSGESLHSFQRARTLGTRQLELVSATSHVENVRRRHQQAVREMGFGRTWLNDTLVEKMLREYELADRIHVHSEYTRQSFLDAGFPADKLVRTHLPVDDRFVPPTSRPNDGVYRIVYVGRLEPMKGLPLLVEAFAKLPVANAELILVGGWSTRSMRRYMEDWITREPRIKIRPGDPLPVLHTADVFVNPSYQDGLGYAPLEALACNVPVIVTEDTGMKEYVVEGENGSIIPTGKGDALLDRLERLYHHRSDFYDMDRPAPASPSAPSTH
jgi:glycosyltransferase involved in cell wall biosynthesis